MAVEVAHATVPITGDNNPLKRVLGQTQKMLNNWMGNIVQGIGQGIGQSIFSSISRGIQAGANLIKSSLAATSNLNESLNKTTVAFGASAKGIIAWSKTSTTSVLLSQQAALEAASGFGLLFSAIHIATNESAEMSKTMVQLAADIASIQNVSVDEALIALKAGLVGETEPLRRFGVLLSAARVEAEALSSGLATNKNNISEAAKVQARYNLIMKDTILTQGDVARTLQGIANQERQLAAGREDALAKLGQAFAPIYLVILRTINRLMGQMLPAGQNIVRSLAEGIGNGIIYILPAIKVIRDVITTWFKPGSPPKILPDLVKWGTQTMQEYLNSYSAADFGVLQTLGSTIEGVLRSFVTSGAIAEGEIVERVFGSRKAIAAAVAQWRSAGRVTAQAIADIEAAAGPAGFSLGGLVRAIFDLEGANRRAADAQRNLNDVTEKYDRLLAPLNEQLDEINDKETAIRNRQARSAARRTLRDPAATANEKRLAQLDIERIAVQEQIEVKGEERDLAVKAAEEKVKAANKEVEVAQAVFNVQQALLDVQIKNNELIGEENDLRRKQAEEAERVYQAALAYNMALASTEGKIALLRLELTRHKEGSVEWYGILTQIAGLEQQLADSGPIVDAESVLPSIDDIDVPQWIKDLGDKIQGAVDEVLGTEKQWVNIGNGIMAPLQGTGVIAEVSQEIKDFVVVMKELTTALSDLVPPLEIISGWFDTTPDEVDEAGTKIDKSMSQWLAELTAELKVWSKLFQGDWSGAWDALKAYAKLQEEETGADFVVWLGSWIETFDSWHNNDWNKAITAFLFDWWLKLSNEFVKQLTGWGTYLTDIWTLVSNYDLSEAGGEFMRGLWEGMKKFWEGTIKPWWEATALGQLIDMLPGSEPKDPASPLRGLKARGAAIMGQLQLGIDSQSLQLPLANAGLLAAGASSVSNSSSSSRVLNVHPGAFQFNGTPKEQVESAKEALKKLFKELANG